jgi:CheY-like chemotaxis protein
VNVVVPPAPALKAGRLAPIYTATMRRGHRNDLLATSVMRAVRQDALILAVADDAEMRAMLEFVLEDAGFRLHMTSTCAAAHAALALGLDPGLILLDVRGRDQSALDFAIAARRHPGLIDVPVLVVAATAPPKSASPITNFLLRPFRAQELLESLRALGVAPRQSNHR